MCASLDCVLQERRAKRREKGKGSSGGDPGLIMPPVSAHHHHTSLLIFIIVILGKKEKANIYSKETHERAKGKASNWPWFFGESVGVALSSVNHMNTNQS